MRRPCLTNTTYLSTYLNISATCHESLPPSSSSSSTTTGSSSSSSSRDLYIIAIFLLEEEEEEYRYPPPSSAIEYTFLPLASSQPPTTLFLSTNLQRILEYK
jgi:hypothetical protein